MRRLSRGAILGISVLIGIAFSVIPPFPALGMLAAALVFPEGVHSDHANAYLVLAEGINFCVSGTLCCVVLTAIFGERVESKSPDLEGAPALPKKGIIYTESEIAEFKRRGLM